MLKSYENPLGRLQLRRGAAFGIMIIGALLSFEIFNYSTTDFALTDLLGELNFLGLRWSTILALAFCGIDFAGIARIFTPEEGSAEPTEVWYLFGAWLLAATMNAMLTWWGVSIAILGHETLGNAVIDRASLLKIVPIFVAGLVWLSRVLLIGSFSIAGERLFSQAGQGQSRSRKPRYSKKQTTQWAKPKTQTTKAFQRARPAPKPQRAYPAAENGYEPTYEPVYTARPEPTYHPVTMKGRNSRRSAEVRN